MGITPSVQLNVPANFSHFSIMFGYTDRLRLILAPQEIINATRSILLTFWTIQDTTEQPGFIEFKLQGTPFSPSQELDKSVKYLMCLLLKEYFALGYHFKASTDLQRNGTASDALIFERKEKISTYAICLSLNSTDKIRVFAPEEVISYIRSVIIQTWPLGIQREEKILNGWEFKLKGNPWGGWTMDNDETYLSAFMINGIIQALYNLGWLYIGAIKSGKRQFDLNSLYFRFDPVLLQSISSNSQSPSRFFAISLNRNDRIRLINAPMDLVSAVRTAIIESWPLGIQEEFTVNVGYEFKIKGNPWWCNGVETVFSRRLVSSIFRLLRQYYWSLYATCELTTHLNSKSVFFSRYNPTENSNFRPLCISLNESDRIRIIDGNQNHVNAVANSIVNGWPDGIQSQGVYSLSYEFKLKGYPFSGSFSNPIYASVVMMHILANLQYHGAQFICSASVSGKYHSDKHGSYPIDLSSLFFLC